MSNYRRKSKPKTEHIKKGFTVFQKIIATLASILGLITASITIMNALDKNKDHKDTTPQTTIIKEVQKEAPAESNAPAQSPSNNQETTQKEDLQTPSKKEDAKSEHLKHFSIPTVTPLVFFILIIKNQELSSLVFPF